MENSDNLTTPPQTTPIKPKSPRVKAAPKPVVEGINSIKSTSDVGFIKQKAPQVSQLTEQEQVLINEPLIQEPPMVSARLMPESVVNRTNKKPGSVKKVLMTGLILLIIIVGGYMAYLWHLNKLSSAPITPGSISNNQTPAPIATIPDNSTSTLPQATGTPMSNATTTPDSSSTPVLTAPVTQLKINSTPTGFLNVRNSPSSAGAVINKVHPGDVYVYTAIKTGWYQITLNDGTSGWVSSQYVTVAQ